MTPHRIASVDIGSNSVLMLVVERRDNTWLPLADILHITRVSEGLDASGLLADEPIRRTAQVLAELAQQAHNLHVDQILATGTGPFRRARNGRRTAERLSAVLGAPIDVVSGEREAELSRLATVLSFPDLHPLVITDIGGASTEIILESDTPQSTSIDIGSVRLAERHLSSDPPSAEERQRIHADIQNHLTQNPTTATLEGAALPLVGIAGTVTTLGAIHLGMETYDAERLHGLHMTPEEVNAVTEQLFTASLDERLHIPGLEPKRADVIPAGAAILSQLMAHLDTDTLIISERGTRWGRLFAEHGA